ncbi:RpiB/LacA/LacB family sugar-phosphate isomerase [Patescibacteria group bacterium]|nr:RpiB/LacA/LacB family sugar-phosphate isomerase [Patescibacteria group bacterium]
MKIFLASDHRGFEQKEIVFSWLKEAGFEVKDLGNDHFDPHDDFVDFASRAGHEVAKDEMARAVIFCGSGAGVNIAANKIKGVRASLAWTPSQVEAARGDDDLNTLVIAADFLEVETTLQLVEVFLQTKFKGEERHVRRLGKILDLEKA